MNFFTMNKKSFLKTAEHLDKIGAYSITDDLENRLLKIADQQTDKGLPPLDIGGVERFIEGPVRAISSLFERGSRTSEQKAETTIRTINGILSSNIAAQNPTISAYLLNAQSSIAREFPGVTVGTSYLSGTVRWFDNLPTASQQYTRYGMWLNELRNVLSGDRRFDKAIAELEVVERYFAKKANPRWSASLSSPTTPGTPSTPAPSTPAPSRTTPGTTPGTTPPTTTSPSMSAPPTTIPQVKKIKSSSINEILYQIIAKQVKKKYPKKSYRDIDKDMTIERNLIQYKIIDQDSDLKEKILEQINNRSPEVKEKLQKLFQKKINDANSLQSSGMGATESTLTTAPESTVETTTVPGEPSVREPLTFMQLVTMIEELDDLSDQDFEAKFEYKIGRINDAINSSARKQKITLEQEYALNIMKDTLKDRYRRQKMAF